MALQTFTAGQVLTAAQVTALQTNDFNQTVTTKTANYTFVVGDRGTRVVGNGTSITFTVDNTIFSAGDTIKIHNINSTALTIAAGAGVTINAAAGLTMVQWQEATLFATSASSFILFESTASTGTPMGVLLATQSFSGVASQSVNDVFSTTYDNYRIVISVIADTNRDVRMRMRVSGSDASGSDYAFGVVEGLAYSPGTLSTPAANVQSSFRIMRIGTSPRSSLSMDLCNPFIATPTTGSGTGFVADGASSAFIVNGLFHNAATSYTGFSIFPNVAGSITGSVSVYGYNK
jgi:hypothetical protein